MSKAKIVIVKESLKELRLLQKNESMIIIKRLDMLIYLKRHGSMGVSKRELSKIIGVDPNSIQKWKTMYVREGITGITTHGRIGFKPSVISDQEHKKIEHKLNQPKNALRGYKELMLWIKDEFGKEVKYTTVVEYCKRHFSSKIKVARKSHVLKSQVAEDAFKKTSVKSSKK